MNETEVSGKSQDDVVTLLRNIPVGTLTTLTVSRQTDDDQMQAGSTAVADQTDLESCEPTKKSSNNGASSPPLRCLPPPKTDENHNPVVDRNVELLELSVYVGDDDTETFSSSCGLGVSIKGMSAGDEDLGLFIKRIIDGRAAAKVG